MKENIQHTHTVPRHNLYNHLLVKLVRFSENMIYIQNSKLDVDSMDHIITSLMMLFCERIVHTDQSIANWPSNMSLVLIVDCFFSRAWS